MNLFLLYVCFAILKSSYYVEALGFFFLLHEYHLSVGHPCIAMLRANFSNFVGEDVELANRALSHTTAHQSGRADVTSLDRSYCLLGSFRPITKLRPLILQVRSLGGWSGNKRLQFGSDDAILHRGNLLRRLLLTHSKTTLSNTISYPGSEKGVKGNVTRFPVC